ncbi:hypothetical protein [Microaceticoccus formicicus]|uniref:hypothetical protein n=1 Tax=Microaceticoccus formicicus TaxID=3118105 RepID=UPI003CD0252F|nr:hypothetical protein VZL98_06870 [Peptoniphilaceae bacterium AMB_02]
MKNKIFINVVFTMLLFAVNTYIYELITKLLFFSINDDVYFLYISLIAISTVIYFLVFILAFDYLKLHKIYLAVIGLIYANNLYMSFELKNIKLIVLFSILLIILIAKSFIKNEAKPEQ